MDDLLLDTARDAMPQAKARQTCREVSGRPEPSADPLRQLDDDPLRAADVAEPIAVFVALHLADELRAVGSQASDDSVDVVDCERDMVRRPQLQRLGCRSAGGNALSETTVPAGPSGSARSLDATNRLQ